MSAKEFVAKRTYGRLGNAGVESSSDDDADESLKNLTPNTRRKVKEEITVKHIKKLSNCETFFTLIKGFVCTGCLYLPKSAFVNGGWLFASFCMVVSAFLTMYCASLLLEV